MALFGHYQMPRKKIDGLPKSLPRDQWLTARQCLDYFHIGYTKFVHYILGNSMLKKVKVIGATTYYNRAEVIALSEKDII